MTEHTVLYSRPTQPLADMQVQLQSLRQSAAMRGYSSVTEFCDRALAAAKGRKRLPALARLLAAVERGEVETVIVSRLSQLGCSVDSLLDVLAALHRASVRLLVPCVIDPAGIAHGTNGGHGRCLTGCSLPQNERRGGLVLDADGTDTEISDLPAAAALLVQARADYRREAILQGQLRAKLLGVRFGRPPLAAGKIERVKVAVREGKGVRETARRFGISPAKVSRLKAELATSIAG